MEDKILIRILEIINQSDQPLETKELLEPLAEKLKKETVTRTKLFYRLTLLRGEGKIKGKFVGPGKGVWIWWRNDAFSSIIK